MKNNLKKHKVKILSTFLFLSLALFVIQNLPSTEKIVESKESVDTKLGQLSDTNNNEALSEGEAVGLVNKKKRNQNEIVTGSINVEIKPESISTAVTSGGEGCNIALNFKLDSNSSYTMDIKNQGGEKCESASVSVYYSNNQTFVSSNPKLSASNYYWTLGDLEPGVTKTIIFSTTNKEGDISLEPIQTEACATANNSEDACATLISKLNMNQTTPINDTTKNTLPVTTPTVPVVTNPTSTFNPETREYGTWVWTSPYAMSASYIDKVIAASVSNKINVIYITIDDYLNINSLPAGIDKETKKEKYSDALENFIILANKNNIQVDVEAGWRDWAEDLNATKANIVIDYAIEYNKTRSNKIRSFQFDVEPYLLSRYEKNKSSVLTNFVNFIGNASNRLGLNNIRFSVVIPHFYDSSQKWTPSINYNNSNNYTFNHLLNILDKRPGSSIILMSYRNTAEGDDGIMKISKTEIDQASSRGHSTKVIVAQEVGNVEPDYVTFYQKSKDYYLSQVNIINNQFKDSSNFGGISVHYIDPLLELR